MAIWGHLASACYFAVFRRPKLARPILFEQQYRPHDSVKANRGSSRASPDIASQVFVGRCAYAKPCANQITDGFGLKLANGMR
jgi:hypothetical protein